MLDATTRRPGTAAGGAFEAGGPMASLKRPAVSSCVSKTSAGSADPAGSRERLVEAHMGWMRCITQGVENRNLDSTASLDRLLRDELAVIQISQAFAAVLRE